MATSTTQTNEPPSMPYDLQLSLLHADSFPRGERGLLTVKTARRGKALDFSGRNPRPGTGSLHPVAETATSSLNLLKRRVLSECFDPIDPTRLSFRGPDNAIRTATCPSTSSIGNSVHQVHPEKHSGRQVSRHRLPCARRRKSAVYCGRHGKSEIQPETKHGSRAHGYVPTL